MPEVLAPSTPEQRAPLYEDVDTLISVGFLSQALSVKGTSVAMRSLGPGDIFLLKARVGAGSDFEWKLWALAQSIWVLDGMVLLGEPNVVPRVVSTLRLLPRNTLDIFFQVLMSLFSRQNKAMDATEAFCYEASSRFLWRTFGQHHPASHSGVPRVETLGSNHVQRMWTFFNEVEDQRSRDDSMWEGFKLTVSAQAPKGVKKIDERDKSLKEQEQRRRQGVLDRFFYKSMGIFIEDSTTRTSYSKSVEDLEDEMYRWVAGIEDAHDVIVREYKQAIVSRYEQEQRDREEKLQALRAERERIQDALGPMSSSLVGYTPEQLKLLLQDRKVGHSGVSFLPESPSRDYLYKKYLERAPDPGVLRPVDGRLVAAEGVKITDTLANRMVQLRADEALEE